MFAVWGGLCGPHADSADMPGGGQSIPSASVIRMQGAVMFMPGGEQSTSSASPDGAATPVTTDRDDVPPALDDTHFVAAIRFNGAALPDYHEVVAAADGTLFLPVEEIFHSAEASVTVEDGKLTLTASTAGEYHLILDRNRGVLETDTGQRPLLESDYRSADGVMLVSDKVLAEVFGLESHFNPATQELTVRSARPFPRDLRLARERRWDRMNATDPAAVPVRMLAQDYTLFGSPQADVSLNWQYGSGGIAGRSTTANWNALVVGEAFWLTHHLYGYGSRTEPLDGLRLRSGRMSASGGVFGVASLYDAQFGDISGVRMPLVGNGGSGRGVRLQAAPLGQATNFDTTLIEGDALPGWDAELYRGTQLLDFQRIGADGRFRFDGIALDYGINEIKVVLYGPQGQVREEIFHQQIGSGMVPPGQVYGTVYALQDDEPLFRRTDTRRAGTPNPWVGGARADLGVSQRLTVGMFAARARAAGESAESNAVDDFYGIEMRPMFGRIGFEAGTARRVRGGSAIYARMAMPVYTTSFSANWERYGRQYASSDNEAGRLSDRATLRFGIPLGTRNLGAVGVRIEDLRRWSGEHERRHVLSWSHRLGPVFMGHQAERRLISGSSSGLYILRASYRRDLFDWRAEMHYGLGAANGLQTFTLSGLWRQNDYNRLFMTVSHSPGSGTSYGVGWSRDLGAAVLSLNASGGGSGGYALDLGLNFSFGHTPGRGLTIDSRPRADMGMLDLHVFEDVDADGVFTPGRDAPIQNVSVLLNRRPLPDGTDANGHLGLNSLPIYDALEIGVDRGRLPDSFLVPLHPAIQAWPRPGRALEVNIPVTESGEISGIATIMLKTGTGARNGSGEKNADEGVTERPLSGIRMQVLDAEGRLHAEVLTFQDGYFIFDTIYPGHWAVRVAPDQTYRGVRLSPVPATVKLMPQSRSAGGLKFVYDNDGQKYD